MRCINCGRQPLASTDTVVCVNENDETFVFCTQCAARLGTCAMCKQSAQCEFAQNPDPMPQFVVQTFQRQTPMGIQTIQQQIKNPERVKKFCIDMKCPCFYEDLEDAFCCRENCATCTNYCDAF